MPQYIIYLRKSREDMEKERRTGEDILSTHRDRLVSICKNDKYIIKEEIVSGDTISGRPVFQEVLHNLIPSKKFDGIIVNEISRLGRGNMKDAGEIYQALTDNNLKVVTPHRVYNPKNRSDLRLIRFELFLSREEFELIRDRLKDGKDASAKSGRAATFLPVLGLKSLRGEYAVDEKGLETVSLLFRLVGEGTSFEQTAKHLNSLGFKTGRGKEWTYHSVRTVLLNDHYLGWQRWGDDIIKAAHGVLIAPEVIYKARNVFKHYDTDSSRRNYKFWVPLYCGLCGKRMYGETKYVHYRAKNYTDKTYEQTQYICIGRRDNPKCSHQIRAGIVHEAVYNSLWELVNDSKLQKALWENNTDTSKEYIAEMQLLAEEKKKKEARLKEIKTDYINGLCDIALYAEAKSTISAQVKIIELRQKEIEPLTHKKNSVSMTQLIKELKSYLLLWEKTDDKIKSAMVRSYTDKVECMRGTGKNRLKVKLRFLK